MQDDAQDHPDAAATQYDMLRDAGFKHLEHAEEDDKRATQRLHKKDIIRQSNRAGAVANHAAENGILESIQCLNFMCHDNLNVELGPLLNFIVGENGSGKSAILTAITLCLGGKASSTNRGGSLKSFIKEGRDRSRLIVKIKNQGRDAYQHEVYGDTIIVERHFSRAGNSGFYVKSETGRTISTKKRDVDEIVEYYCLQVDNPLNVLSQDNARQFLNAASAKQKYRFFLQGVQLQQLDDDFRVIEEYLNANEHKEGELQTKVEVAEKEYKKAKEAFVSLQESGKLQDQLALLRQKHLWAQVGEKERELAALERKLGEVEQEIAEAKATAESRSEALEQMDNTIEQLKQSLDGLMAENQTLSANKDQAKDACNKAKEDLAGLVADQRDARNHIESRKKTCRDLQEKIDKEQGRLEALNGDALTRKNEELAAAHEKLGQTERKIRDANTSIPDLEEKLKQANASCDKTNSHITQKKKDLENTRARIRDIVAGQGSLYDGYNYRMRDLLQAIEAEGGFERKPVGPIGAHVRVLQPMWSPMLERLFGESLNGFVVVNKRDQTRLSGIMKRLGIDRSPILIGNPSPIDTSHHEPDKLYTTILRILEIDDPLVRNQLIINNRIEKTILVQSKDEADHIMLGTAPPRNVTACYHPFPSKGHGWTVRVTVNINGANSAPQSPPHSNQKPRLQSDSRKERTILDERLNQLQRELKDLETQKAEQQQSCQRNSQEIHECKRLEERLSQERRNIKAEIEGIRSELDNFDGADDKLNTLRDELVKAKDELEQYENEYGNIGLRRDEKNQQVEQLHSTLKEEAKKLRDFESDVKKMDDKIQRAEDSRLIALKAKNQALDNHNMLVIRGKKDQADRDELEKTVAEWNEEALAKCARVEVWEDESYTIIEKKMASLEKTIAARAKKRGMSDEKISEQAEQAKLAYDSIKKACEQVKKENRGLKNTLQQRLERWRLFQRYISSNSRSNFMYLLSERDFRGKLILDHKNHTLEVQVEPDKTRKNAAARNTRTLSGGEKSFSSICLLLAIWEAMGSPLRCLDEFDVFMDNVNRRVSTEMLVRFPPPRADGED